MVFSFLLALLALTDYSSSTLFHGESYNLQCILNAHAALLAFLLTIRIHSDGNNAFFASWHLGSQSCEKVFRSVRRMTNTFSTVKNFSILGLL